MADRNQSDAPGVFSAHECYTFRELRRRGLKATLLRLMQARGMKARRLGKDKIVLGSDLLEFFATLPVCDQPPSVCLDRGGQHSTG